MPNTDYGKFESFSVLDFKVFILLFMSAVDGEIHPAEINDLQNLMSQRFNVDLDSINESINKVCAHFDECRTVVDQRDSLNYACVLLKEMLEKDQLNTMYNLCEDVSKSDETLHPNELDALKILRRIWELD